MAYMGVYTITNKANLNFYIGSSTDILMRWESHRKALRGGYHHNPRLQASWNKYGEQMFDFDIVHRTDDEDATLALEQSHLDEHYSKPNCYNHKNVATGFSTGDHNPNYKDGSYGKKACPSCGVMIDKKASSCRSCWHKNKSLSDVSKGRIGESRKRNKSRVYHTPWGTFDTIGQAVKACPYDGCRDKSLRSWCESYTGVINNFSYGQSSVLKQLGDRDAIVGKTRKDIGFYYSENA